jgi:hypothetical protein
MCHFKPQDLDPDPNQNLLRMPDPHFAAPPLPTPPPPLTDNHQLIQRVNLAHEAWTNNCARHCFEQSTGE